MSVHEESIKALKEFVKSDKGRAYFQKIRDREKIHSERLKLVGQYLSTCDFGKLIKRLQNEHNEKYRDREYAKGIEPGPNNKHNLLYDYLEANLEPVVDGRLPNDFLDVCYYYKGHYFTVYCGLGCFYRIYDTDLNIILQS
jgi:hypothetical protein